MKHESENIELLAFENESFVSECLESFDANVAKVEAEYEDSNKSA